MSRLKRQGLLIVLSGPSGVGKGTVCTALRRLSPELVYSVSATTRKPRQGEVDGVNYFFKTREQFMQMIERGELLEWAEYVGNYYGTPAEFVRRTIESGQDIILEIDVQGAMQVKRNFPNGVFIFLTPPSLDELRLRIEGRGTESDDVIRERMRAAREEMSLMAEYNYAVINDDVESACRRIQAIITAEHCRKERMMPLMSEWFEEVK
jgi:guanylate kinase